MASLPFDPSKAVTFDLSHGQVHLEDAPTRVLVPASAVVAVCAAAGAEATLSLGRALGEPMGKRAAKRLGEASGATIESVVEHLGGELALAGLGSLGVERWGRALVLVVDQSPLGNDGDALLASVLEAAVGAASGKDVRAVKLGREQVRARFLVTGASAAEKVRTWLGAGTSWGDALARLHDAGGDRRGDS